MFVRVLVLVSGLFTFGGILVIVTVLVVLMCVLFERCLYE